MLKEKFTTFNDELLELDYVKEKMPEVERRIDEIEASRNCFWHSENFMSHFLLSLKINFSGIKLHNNIISSLTGRRLLSFHRYSRGEVPLGTL